MKTSFIEKANQASIELLITLPIFAVMAWGVGTVYLHLSQKSRLERAVWVYGISVAHKSDPKYSEKKIQGLKRSEESHFKPEQSKYCYELAASPGTEAFSFPIAFAGYLATNCAQNFKVSTTSNVENVIDRFRLVELLKDRVDRMIGTRMSNRANIIIPGSDFNHSSSLKQLMWSELMLQIKHEPLPLQLLGATEFSRAFSGGIPSADVGQEAMNLAVKFGMNQFGISSTENGLSEVFDQYKKIIKTEVEKNVHEAMAQSIPSL